MTRWYRLLCLVCALVVACGEAASDAAVERERGSDLNLLFVANEGVLVYTDSTKVLIDALFTTPNPEYAAPTAEMLGDMEHGTPPFDDLDLLLVTHNHPDHFEPTAAARCLQNNGSAILMAPEDAVAAMEDSVDLWTNISDRVISVSLEPGNSLAHDIDGIVVNVYRTLHSGQRAEPQNVMYLVEMDGRTVFHEGDSDGNPGTFEEFGLAAAHVDLALVHFWFPTSLEGERILKGILRADHVALFHLPKRLMEEAPETIGQVAADYPDMFLLINPGERKVVLRQTGR